MSIAKIKGLLIRHDDKPLTSRDRRFAAFDEVKLDALGKSQFGEIEGFRPDVHDLDPFKVSFFHARQGFQFRRRRRERVIHDFANDEVIEIGLNGGEPRDKLHGLGPIAPASGIILMTDARPVGAPPPWSKVAHPLMLRS